MVSLARHNIFSIEISTGSGINKGLYHVVKISLGTTIGGPKFLSSFNKSQNYPVMSYNKTIFLDLSTRWTPTPNGSHFFIQEFGLWAQIVTLFPKLIEFCGNEVKICPTNLK